MLTRWRVLAAAALLVAAPATAWAARGYVTDSVNLRAGPGTEYPIVDTIPDGAHLTIHGCVSDAGWCDVSWSSDRGWVSADYLNYLYNNRYVYLPDYVDVIDVPVVTFTLGSYWGDYYTGRPWYHRLHHWQQVWREHGRYGHSRGHHRFAHGGRHHHVAGANRGNVRTGRGHRRDRTADVGRHHQTTGRAAARHAAHARHNLADRHRGPNVANHRVHRNFAHHRAGQRMAGHRGAGRFAAHRGASGMRHGGGRGMAARAQAIRPHGGGMHMGGGGHGRMGGGGHMGGGHRGGGGGGGGHGGGHGGGRHH